MEIETSSGLLVRRGILSALMVGLALVYIIQGREPGAALYIAAAALAVVFFVTSFTGWQRTGWVGVVAYAALVSGLMTGEDGLLGTLLGLFLAALTALQPFNAEEDEESGEADGALDRFQAHST